MRINTAIRGLWKSGFFLQHRRPKEVRIQIFNEYQITCSNISQHLTSSKKFLRRDTKGWIQKSNYTDDDKTGSKSNNSIKSLLDNDDLWSVCKASFENGKFWDACLLALRHLETKIRKRSSLTAGDHGTDLVVKAFNPNNGILKIPSCEVPAEEEGFLAINRGMVLFHRNAKGHREGSLSKKNAVKLICYIDFLLEILKTAEKRN